MNKTSKVLTFLGTRPEIIKLSPLLPRFGEVCERHVLVLSGQHYSDNMEAMFFRELQLPQPDYSLKVGEPGIGAAEQTARMLSGLEPILLSEKPDLVIVQGDTNTTLAGALAAVKLGIPVLHLEAGCRSFNRAMPEELNRVLVDNVAQLLLAPDKIAVANLNAEGCNNHAQIYLVGSTGLEACLRAASLTLPDQFLSRIGVSPQNYLALTLHRAENTNPEVLPGLVSTINALATDFPVVFPIHPRTEAAIARNGLSLSPNVICLEPLGYLEMLQLVKKARVVLTDSGGLQEEAALLGTPVLVLRNETEWSYLVEAGKAVLIGNKYPEALSIARNCLESDRLQSLREAIIVPPSNISDYILEIIANFLTRDDPYSPQNFLKSVAKEIYVQV